MKSYLCLLLCLITTIFAEDPCDTEICCPPTSEAQCLLFAQINCESQRLYNSLDCLGKNRAIELSSQIDDKNIAVQQAAKEMAKRQRDEYPNQYNYQKQLRDRSGQDDYNSRFGY